MLPQTPHIDTLSEGLISDNPLSQRLVTIFCYRWHWILKEADGWRTETEYPIKPAALWKAWQDVTTFIGVRFGQFTRYGLIDIDINSIYHPNQDPSAIPAIVSALESIGIYRVLIIRSSDSGGIHIYVPLDAPIATYGLASALKFCCEDAGFKLAPGQLEIFPNCKAFRKDSATNYNGHRLPLQTGSYLLNEDYQPITNDLSFFLKVWEMSAAGNDNQELEAAIALNKKRPGNYSRGGQSKGEKWRADCEAAIATGWTGHGQTNELLGTFAQYGRVFLALAGDELTQWMITTAINAPGYSQWCRHQHHIERRCREWVKGSEGCYYPYPSFMPRSKNPWGKSDANDEKSASAIERIKSAYEAVKKFAYQTATDLANSIAAIAKCSFTTLYKHRHLWQSQSFDDSEGCVIAENPYTELDQADQQQNTPKTLEPLPGEVLHTRCYKKVGNPPEDFESDQTSEKTHPQPPLSNFSFDFAEQNPATDAQNHRVEGDSRDSSSFSTDGVKHSLTSVDFSGCCNADSNFTSDFFESDRRGESIHAHLSEHIP